MFICVCVGGEELSVKEGKKAKKRKKSKHMNKHQVPAEMATEPELAKYWAQRYRLFSRFDQGIKLDRGQYFTLLIPVTLPCKKYC